MGTVIVGEKGILLNVRTVVPCENRVWSEVVIGAEAGRPPR